ncbi:protein AKNAD1 isoform X1 [Crocuta crocuta]
MEEASFSEDRTSKQQERLPFGRNVSQIKIHNDYKFTSKNDILDVSYNIMSTVGEPQEKAPYKETCRNADMAKTSDEMTKIGINKNYDKEKQSTINLDIPANERDPSKSNLSNILLHHLSREKFLKGQGINCAAFPKISNADRSDEAVIKNIILRYTKNSCPKEKNPELTGPLSPKSDGENSNKHCCSRTMREENTSDLEEPVVAGESSYQETSNFLTKIKSPCDKPKSFQGQPPQKQQTEKVISGSVFKYGHGQVHYQFSDFFKVAAKVKIPKINIVNEPLIEKQASLSPKLRDESVIVQDILESLSRSNCIEKQKQKRKTTDNSQQIEMEPTMHIHQEHLTGIESEASFFKVSSTSQKDPCPSSSYIFQKITEGKQMCQKLKEQTDQLKTKVQEFSKSIAHDSPYHLQDKKLVLEKLQGHLELLEQEFWDNKEMHLTLKQVHRHEPPAVGDFDPEREVEGEIFKLEMLLEDVKEKINKGKYTSAVSLSGSSPPIIPDDLASTSSPPSNEENPNNTSERPDHAETTSPSCACSHPVLEWKENIEKKGHRRPSCGRCSTFIQKKTLHTDSVLGSDTGHSCSSAPETGLSSDKGQNCGTKSHNSGRACDKKTLEEFYYRYNTPGENSLNHSERSDFVQLCFLNENKNSSSSCSKPEWICSQTSNPKSSQDEHEPIPGKKNRKIFMTYSSDLATPTPHFHPSRISGIKSLSNFDSMEMESEILNSSLDHALRTATILKETTDRMITTVAEDLAKVQRWRNQLKY